MMKPVLFTYFRSSCSWRVRIALSLKKIEYEAKYINLIKDGGDQHTDDYRKTNPLRQVPSLQIGDEILNQSLPIIEYLDATFPNAVRLFPKDHLAAAKARQIAEMMNSGIQPLQNLSVLQYVGDKKVEWAKHWISRGFDALEQKLSQTSGKYCISDTITIADLCLVPQVANAERFKVDLSSYPIISRINDECLKHPAFSSTHPFRQPDCPDELKIQ